MNDKCVARESNTIGISESRLKHALQVARTTKFLAKKLLGWSEEKCQEMFLLGYIHDIGYEFSNEQSEHPLVGSELLKEAGYKYWKEVRWHGIPSPPYKSDELLILNMADLLTNGEGKVVSLEQRLADIAARYETESKQYRDAQKLSADIAEAFADLDFVYSEYLKEHW